MPRENQEKRELPLSVSKTNGTSKADISAFESDKSSIISIVCRICYDGDEDEAIITPCHCKGTVAFVHRSCLETWLAESNTAACELCHHTYVTERTPKYKAAEAIWRWIRYPPGDVGFEVRTLKNDLMACAILTPLAIVISYLCLFSADYYNQKKFASVPATKWTSVSLLLMIVIMLLGYFVWVYMVVNYHGRVWYYCWQRECVVRYIPPLRQTCSNSHLQITDNSTRLELTPSDTSTRTEIENREEIVTV